MKTAVEMTYKLARRIVIGVVGTSVLLVGLIMVVTPGPAVVVIPLGLTILGLEFAWARRWLVKVRERISEESRKHRDRRAAQRQRDAGGTP